MSVQSICAHVPDQVIARFWAKVNKEGKIPAHKPELGPCWIWIASLRNKGYGAFGYTIDDKTIQDRAHRFSFVLHGGVLLDGECVLHHCDTPACVNPHHLFSGTKAINNEDMRTKGRHVSGGTKTPVQQCKYERGEGHHAAILTQETVRQIRAEHATGIFSYSQLARRHDLAIGHVYRIIKRKAWKHVQ